jgi:hypothetical protein
MRDLCSCLAAVVLTLTVKTACAQPGDYTLPSTAGATVSRGIAAVALALESQMEESESLKAGELANRDLAAQENMAFWAMGMFWTAVASVLLTSLGVVLIWRTLIYTRKAANAASDTVAEARKATKAARQGVKEARNATKEAERSANIQETAFQRLERPYIFPEIEEAEHLVNRSNEIPFLLFKFINYGKLPAVVRRLRVKLVESRDPKTIVESELKSFHVVLPPGADFEGTVPVENSKVGDHFQVGTADRLLLIGYVEYEDPTGTIHSDRFCGRLAKDARGFTLEGGGKFNSRDSKYPSVT